MDQTTTYTLEFESSTSESSRMTINLDFKVRNVLLGSLGLLANLMAFLIVLKSNKVKKGRKLLLLNLILSDALCVGSLVVYALDESTQISEGSGCVPMMYALILAIQNSYMLCLVLSIVNFLAVYKPFQYAMLVSWKNTGIAVFICWITMAGCTYWWVVSSLPPGFICAPIVIMPDPGLIGLSTVLLVTSFGVFGLNGAVVFKLKKMSRIHPFHASQTNAQSQRSNISIFSQMRQRFSKRTKDKVKPLSETDTPSGNYIWMGDNVPKTPISVHQVEPNTSHAAVSTSRPSSTPFINQELSLKELAGASGTTLTAQPDRKPSSSPSISTSRDTAGDKICRDLAILTSFSCIMTLSIAIYLICIAVGTIHDPEDMVGTAIGIFVSSCPISKAVINPFFYVLNFVSWRQILRPIFGHNVTGQDG